MGAVLDLKPLRAIERQANAIAQRDFITIDESTGATELRSVMNAMNRMAEAIKKNFDTISAEADKLQAEAFIDELTQLGNRRAFIDQLTTLLKDTEQPRGTLWFVRMTGLESLQQRAGAPVAKDQIKRVCNLCKDVAEHYQGVAFRTSESEVAMLIPQSHHLQQDATSLAEALEAMAHPEQTQGVAIIGLCEYLPGMEMKQLLANADHALTLAGQPGENKYHILAPDEQRAADQLDISQRREKLLQLITPPRLQLSCQPILARDKHQVIMYELLSRFFDEHDRPLNTPDLFAELSRLGLISALDKAVIVGALSLAQQYKQARFAVNLSMQSMLDSDFVSWLRSAIQASGDSRSRITFELSEYVLQQHMSAAERFIQQVRTFGFKITIEKFGVSTLPFAYLRQIRPDHIKVAGNYVHNLQEDKENRNFLRTLIQMGHGLDISVFAEQVEQQIEADLLHDLNVDGVQGYLFGQPRPADEYLTGSA